MKKDTLFFHKNTRILMPILLFIGIVMWSIFLAKVYFSPTDQGMRLLMVPFQILSAGIVVIGLIFGVLESNKNIKANEDEIFIRSLFKTHVFEKDDIDKVQVHFETAKIRITLLHKPTPTIKGITFKFLRKSGEAYILKVENQSGDGWAVKGEPNSVYGKACAFFQQNNIPVEVTNS